MTAPNFQKLVKNLVAMSKAVAKPKPKAVPKKVPPVVPPTEVEIPGKRVFPSSHTDANALQYQQYLKMYPCPQRIDPWALANMPSVIDPNGMYPQRVSSNQWHEQWRWCSRY